MISRAFICKNLVKGIVRCGDVKISPLTLSRLRGAVHAFSTENKPPLYGIHSKIDNSDPLQSERMSEASLHQNHIWSTEEIRDALKSLYRHKPVTLSDKIMKFVVSLFKSFLSGRFENHSSSIFFSDDQLVQNLQLCDGLRRRQRIC